MWVVGGVSRCLAVVQARAGEMKVRKGGFHLKLKSRSRRPRIAIASTPDHPQAIQLSSGRRGCQDPPSDSTIFWVGVPRPPKRFNYILGGGVLGVLRCAPPPASELPGPLGGARRH